MEKTVTGGFHVKLFTHGKKSQAKEDGQVKEAELFQQIGKLQMELEWIKKNLSCSDAHERQKLVDPDRGQLTISHQYQFLGLARSTHYYKPVLSVIPRWRSWPGLMPSTWRIPPVVAAGLFTV